MKKNRNFYGFMFIGTALVLLSVFMFYPIVYSFGISFTSTKGIVTNFVGIRNYTRIFSDPLFLIALKNTLLFLAIQVPVMLLLAIFFAAVLNDKTIRFRGFFRTALFLPCVTSLIAYTILFKMIFSYEGLMNSFLLAVGVIKKPLEWLMNPHLARLVLILAMLWRWTGYNMVFYLSAMQNISGEIYEAAQIDGSGRIHSFFHITLPLLKPMILFTTVMSTIGTLQLFDEPMNLAQGGITASTIGPGNSLLTLSVYIYNTCFKYVPNFGYAATISYVIVIIIGLLTMIQFALGKSESDMGGDGVTRKKKR